MGFTMPQSLAADHEIPFGILGLCTKAIGMNQSPLFCQPLWPNTRVTIRLVSLSSINNHWNEYCNSLFTY